MEHRPDFPEHEFLLKGSVASAARNFFGRSGPMQKKLSIICFSGNFDKAIAAFTMASGAAACGYEVNLFFTFWGLNMIKKKKDRSFLGSGFMARVFNWLMGGFRNLPMSSLNFAGLSPRIMSGLMKKRKVMTLPELLQASIDMGANFYICEMSMVILGMKKDDFIPEIKEVLGVGRFLEKSHDGQTLFI